MRRWSSIALVLVTLFSTVLPSGTARCAMRPASASSPCTCRSRIPAEHACCKSRAAKDTAVPRPRPRCECRSLPAGETASTTAVAPPGPMHDLFALTDETTSIAASAPAVAPLPVHASGRPPGRPDSGPRGPRAPPLAR